MRVQKYKRGQIWWYQMSTGIGNRNDISNAKTRPVIIISNDLQNAHSNYMIAIPCTSADKKSMPTHTIFELNNTQCTALAENMTVIDKDYIGAYMGTLDEDLLKQIETNCKIVLGLQEIEKEKIEVPIRIPVKKPPTINEYIETLNDTEPKFIDDSPMEEKLSTRKAYEGVGRKGYQKYTKEQMLRFIHDCENHTIVYVTKKYGCSSEKATSNKLYRFRKFLKENP